MPPKPSSKREGPITVVIADHQPLTRTLIAERLASTDGFTILAEVNDATAALAACTIKPNPDILLLRSDLPGYSPFAASRNLHLQNAHTRTAIIFPTIIDQQLDDALASNTHGLLSHEDTPEDLIAGLRELAQTGTYHAPSIRHRLITLNRDGTDDARHASPLVTLTNRERDILRLIAEGMTQRQIADRFGLAPKTIDNHAGKMMHKLGLHNRVLLTRYAIREGIVTADDSPTAQPPLTRPVAPGPRAKGERTDPEATPNTR